MKKLIFILNFWLFCVIPGWAFDFDGEKTIKLVEIDGTQHVVGTITFKPDGEKASYIVNWQDGRFAEHFLSMRPFRCLEGSLKYWCRVPYPYPNKHTVSATDLKDLEYDTLFIWKGATEYGINMWNGIYYKLEVSDHQLIGKINEMDMNKLSAPPEEGNFRPLEEQDLETGEHESHWLPLLIIE